MFNSTGIRNTGKCGHVLSKRVGACTVSAKFAVCLVSVSCECLFKPTVCQCLKWCFDLLSRLWEWLADTVFEHHWFVLIRHTPVHHGAVPVALDMGFETLMWSTPAHFANLCCGQGPIRKAMENLPQLINSLAVHHVHESIAQICITVEITWQVDKVIFALHPMLIEHLQKHLPGVVVGQVAQHHCGAFLAFALPKLWLLVSDMVLHFGLKLMRCLIFMAWDGLAVLFTELARFINCWILMQCKIGLCATELSNFFASGSAHHQEMCPLRPGNLCPRSSRPHTRPT